MNGQTSLTPREVRIIAAAIAHERQEDAAAAVRVHLRTFQRTLGRPHVQEALAAEAIRRLRRVTVSLARHAEQAVADLGRMATGAIAATSARVRACIAVADLSARAIELEDHGRRLDALEAELATRAPTGGWQ